jgi:uncharacterized protein (DUF305 family)
MKKIFLPLLFLSIVLVLGGLACNSDTEGSRNSRNRNSTTDQNMIDHSQMNHGAMNHNAVNSNAANINQAPMDHSHMQTSPDAKTAPYDLQFLDTMIAHHQGAVVMAKPAMEKAQHDELKNLALSIITSQEKEVAQMREWRDKWYAGKPVAVNMEMPGMNDSMKGMDMKRLGTATGKDFDLAFIEMMIPHHEGALAMAKEALEKAEHPEIKTLAQSIIMAQETEIKSMGEWKEKWTK